MGKFISRLGYSFRSSKGKDALAGYLFILPGFSLFAVFFLYPLVRAVGISFQEWQILGESNFVGIDNYKFLFGSYFFVKSLTNSFLFAMIVAPASIIAGLLLAVLMNQKLIGVRFFRACYFIPVISTMVAVAMIWMWLYRYENGLINYLLSFIGIKGPAWLREREWALPAIALVIIWRGLGLKIMIYLAALQGISKNYYEAAEIDGATKLQILRYITIPLVSPATLFIAIVTIINVFKVFDIIFVTTEGGPWFATTVVSYFIYLYGFNFFLLGPACAAAILTLLLVLVLTFLQFKASKSWVHY